MKANIRRLVLPCWVRLALGLLAGWGGGVELRAQTTNVQPRLAISVASNGSAPVSMSVTGAPDRHYLIQSAPNLPSPSVVNSGAGNLGFAWAYLPEAVRESLLPRDYWTPHHLRLVSPSNGAAPMAIHPSGATRFFRAVEHTGTVERVTFLRRECPREPGQKFNLAWVFTNDAPNLEQQIRLRAPGVGSTDSRQLAGSPPASGVIYYLTEAGQWTTNVTARPGFGGNLTNGLPEVQLGRWQLEFLLRDTTSDGFVEVSAIPFLVGDVPALTLDLNRTIANPVDLMSASVELVAGSSPQNVQLLAWLVQPDGSQSSLPTLGPGSAPLFSGPSANATFGLFQRRFTNEGDYVVEARLIDDFGNVLGLARRTFAVCDGPSVSVTGVVYSAAGGPLGAGAARARVRAYHLDEPGVATAVDITTGGSFVLSLLPGRYDLSAVVHDGGGLHETTNDLALVLACQTNAPVVSLSITTAPPSGPPASPLSITAASSAVKNAGPVAPSLVFPSDGLPPPTVFVEVVNDSGEALTGYQGHLVHSFVEELRRLNPSVSFIDLAAMRVELSQIARRQSSGTSAAVGADDAARLMALGDALNTDFILKATFWEDYPVNSGREAIIGRVIDMCSRSEYALNDMRLVLPPGEGFEFLDMDTYAQTCTTGFGGFTELRARQCRPIQPYVGLTLNSAVGPPNGTLTATAVLREKDATGAVQAGRPIQFTITRPDGTGDSVTRNTDANGQAAYPFNLGAAGQTPGQVTARFLRENVTVGQFDTVPFRVQAANASALSLSSVQAQVATSGQAPIVLTLNPSTGGSGANTVVQLTTDNGALASPGGTTIPGGLEVTTSGGTGNSGHADVTLTAGTQNGLARVNATCSVTNNGVPQNLQASIVFAVEVGLQVLTYASPPETLGGLLSQVVVETRVDGARRPALPVTFSLQGSGVLSNAATLTDASGRAEVLFLAPTNPASGTSVISAVIIYDQLPYTNTASVSWEPAPECTGITNNGYCLEIIKTPLEHDTFTLALNDLGEVLFREGAPTPVYKLWKRGVMSTVHQGAEFLNNRRELAGTDADGGWVLRAGVTNRLPFPPVHLDDEGWVYYINNITYELMATKDGVTIMVGGGGLFAGRTGAVMTRTQGQFVQTGVEVPSSCENGPSEWVHVERGCPLGGIWLGADYWIAPFVNILGAHEEVFSLVSRTGSRRQLFINGVNQPSTLEVSIINSRGEIIGTRYRPDQPEEYVIGTPPGTPLVVPGNTLGLFAQGLNSSGEALFATYTDDIWKVWHRKGGINRELSTVIPTIPGWQVSDGLALNENGQMLVRGTGQNGGLTELALWLVTPLR